MATMVPPYSSVARVHPGSLTCWAKTSVGNGTKAMNIRKATLIMANAWFERPMTVKSRWCCTHMTPIVRKLTT